MLPTPGRPSMVGEPHPGDEGPFMGTLGWERGLLGTIHYSSYLMVNPLRYSVMWASRCSGVI